MQMRRTAPAFFSSQPRVKRDGEVVEPTTNDAGWGPHIVIRGSCCQVFVVGGLSSLPYGTPTGNSEGCVPGTRGSPALGLLLASHSLVYRTQFDEYYSCTTPRVGVVPLSLFGQTGSQIELMASCARFSKNAVVLSRGCPGYYLRPRTIYFFRASMKIEGLSRSLVPVALPVSRPHLFRKGASYLAP